MGYICIKGNRACYGCMGCKPSPCFYCPVCGKEVYETVFVDNGGDVIGCENCAEIKEPHEVLTNEAE